jgi:AraC-like DNA-binding protein/quercetin dioxygenase-like cupin family protein
MSQSDFIQAQSRVQIGPGSRHEGIRTDLPDAPPWIQGYVLSPLLNHYEIFHMGIVSADTNYCVSRVRSPYTHFLACLSGEASLWTEGEYYQLKPGTACLLPQDSTHMDQTAGSGPWQFCYVCYLTKNTEAGFHGLSKALVAEYDPLPLRYTIEALRHACGNHGDAECQRQLLGVVNHLVLRFIGSRLPDEWFRLLWQRVAATPAEDWSLERLEREAHCHREHLRRLCQRHLGRSPIQHVAYLRMQHAAMLLSTTSLTLDHIATKVRYADAFSFSSAFKHWFKISPARYRIVHRNGRSTPPPPWTGGMDL